MNAIWAVIPITARVTVSVPGEKPVKCMKTGHPDNASLWAEAEILAVEALADAFHLPFVKNNLINEQKTGSITAFGLFFHRETGPCQSIPAVHQIKFHPIYHNCCFATDF
jgi:hypothetical protein